MMNQYIVPLPHNDPRLFSHASHAFSLVDLGKQLLEAAKNGDVEELKSLMNNGAPFTTDWLGISPLHFAAMNGHLSSCEALLCAGISRDARTKVDRTPLHLAAQEGHADIVELLLRSGADIGAKDMLQMTALHWAAERGHTPVVQMLMRFGADARVQNKFEMTPLDIASSKGHFDARDAMLNTRDDMVSLVGRMAATSGNLVDANAYILTEEETLVPAAPPAGEVVVTATTVEETIDDEHASNLEQLKKEQGHSLSGDLISPKSLWDHEIRSPVLECVTAPDIDSPSNQLLNPHCMGLQPNAVEEPTTAMPRENATHVVPDEILHQDGDEDFGRDIMLVETPDGDMLHIRQFGEDFSSGNLAIFTSTGERVHNPHLMSQVIEALADLPKDDNPESSTESGLSVAMKPDASVNSKEEFPTHMNNLTDDTLLIQLASFIEAADPKDESVCVDDVGPGASVDEFCNWCSCHGLSAQNLGSESDFVVNFNHDHQSFSLHATYDRTSGTTRFYIPKDRIMQSSCE